MNKKLLVLAIVPVLVMMSGALAFSAFSGGATTIVSTTAGNIDFSQNFTGYYLYGSAHPIDPAYATPSQTTTQITLSADNFSPGSWIEFNLTLNYTGTVPIVLSETTTTGSVSGAAGGIIYNHSAPSSTFKYGTELTGYGFYYNVTSVPSGVIEPNSPAGNVSYHVFIGLANSSNDNGFIGSSFNLTTTITVTSVP